MRVVLIIPTYNEAQNIAEIVPRAVAALPDAEIRIVDDSSPDGTADVVRELQQTYAQISLSVRPAKTGLGSAYVETFADLVRRDDVDAVCTMDADFSHSPDVLPSLVAALATHDLVVGSRYVSGGEIECWQAWRRVLSGVGNVYASAVAGVPIRDLTSGLVAFRRTILAAVDLSRISSSGYAYTIESKCLAVAAGGRAIEIPISFGERRRGRSKIDLATIREGVIAPWRMRRLSERPLADGVPPEQPGL